MRIVVSGLHGGEHFKRTHGDAELLAASDNGVIEHIGDTEQAIAKFSGRITVSGMITERANASDHGVIFAHGDTDEVIAGFSGSVTLAGNPGVIEATDNASVIIFGQPKLIRTRHSGSVTVVTSNTEYEPESLYTSDHGSVRLITPGTDRAQVTSNYLNYHLEKLFPGGQADPLYVAYAGLLELNQDKYLTV